MGLLELQQRQQQGRVSSISAEPPASTPLYGCVVSVALQSRGGSSSQHGGRYNKLSRVVEGPPVGSTLETAP